MCLDTINTVSVWRVLQGPSNYIFPLKLLGGSNFHISFSFHQLFGQNTAFRQLQVSSMARQSAIEVSRAKRFELHCGNSSHDNGIPLVDLFSMG